ncbi:DUF6309 family protein [Kitasatospora sp. NPDC001309]|uniref:DUF6309 family protein n=1 Tax=Kitasatospora sp. NPDC001309 TaxID=3364013 RepID=UPI00367FD69D
MEIVSAVAYSEVHRAYLRDHPVERAHEGNTNLYGEENLERADEEVPGGWWRVRLTRADVLGVVLPWHLSEGGERELVPRTGLTVARAVERVRSGGADWAAANPVCSGKLRLLGRAPFTALYLATAPVDHPDYERLAVRRGLIHVDGLHRMLAWELAGRLRDGTVLDGYLAGDPAGLDPPGPGRTVRSHRAASTAGAARTADPAGPVRAADPARTAQTARTARVVRTGDEPA